MKKLLLLLMFILTLYGCENEAIKKDEPEEPLTIKYSLLPVSAVVEDEILWGYVNTDDLDKFILPPQYQSASLYNKNNLAIVKDETFAVIDETGLVIIPFGEYESLTFVKEHLVGVKEGRYVLLDVEGNPYGEQNYDRLYEQSGLVIANLNDQFYVFDEKTETFEPLDLNDKTDFAEDEIAGLNNKTLLYDEATDRYIYVVNGLERSFDYAEPFVDGYAVVGHKIEDSYFYIDQYLYGVIKEDGEFLFEPIYPYIAYLGQEYFEVAEPASIEALDYFVINYSSKAFKKSLYRLKERIFNNVYYSMTQVDEDLFYVHDGHNYHFVDGSGQRQFEQHDFYAQYDFYIIDDLYVGALGNEGQIYFNDVNYKENNLFQIIPGGVVELEIDQGPTYSSNYPVLKLEDQVVSDAINQTISALSEHNPHEEVLYFDESDEGFSLTVFNEILIYNQYATWYGFGAAHGNYAESTVHFDLRTGKVLTLNDLFITDDVQTLIAELLADYDYKEAYFYIDMDETSKEERIEYFTYDAYNYRVNDQGLTVYFNPYEVGPYAAGIITFEFDFEGLSEYLKDNTPFLN